MGMRSLAPIEEEYKYFTRSLGELMSLAANASSIPVIWKLAKHRSTAVRGMLYNNPNTPEPVILYLQRLHVRDFTSEMLNRVRKFPDSERVLTELVLRYKGVSSQRAMFTQADTEALGWLFHLNEKELEYVIDLIHTRKDYVYAPTVASAIMCDVRVTNDVKDSIMQHYKRYNIFKDRIFHGVFVSTYEIDDIIAEDTLSFSQVPYDQIVLNDTLMSEYAEQNPHRLISESWMLPKKAANIAFFSKKATPFLLDGFTPAKKESRMDARPIDHIGGSWQDAHSSHFFIVYQMGILNKYKTALERVMLLHPNTKPSVLTELVRNLDIDETYWALYNVNLLEPSHEVVLHSLQTQGHKLVRDEANALHEYKIEMDELIKESNTEPVIVEETEKEVIPEGNPLAMLLPHERHQLADSLTASQETLMYLYDTFEDCQDRVLKNPMFEKTA